MERLDKVISNMGLRSRKEVKDLVRARRILVDGVPAASPDMKVDPAVNKIVLEGRPLVYEKFTYIMLNKPAGVLTATEDRRQETVIQLLSDDLQKRELGPVGRLDKDTEGLLILTNDGELTHRLLSPRYHVDKVYYAKVDHPLEPGDCDKFAEGIVLANGLRCMPARLEILSDFECLVTVQEGKFHQVKRMLASCGKRVQYLKRLSMGEVKLDDTLATGEYRRLTDEEVMILRKSTNSEDPETAETNAE